MSTANAFGGLNGIMEARAREARRPDTGTQDALEHLYAELGRALVRRREFCSEASTSPPASAQVSEIAEAIATLGKVHWP